MPVVWHQTLLCFVQRYKDEIRPEDKAALRKLCTLQSHYLVRGCCRGARACGVVPLPSLSFPSLVCPACALLRVKAACLGTWPMACRGTPSHVRVVVCSPGKRLVALLVLLAQPPPAEEGEAGGAPSPVAHTCTQPNRSRPSCTVSWTMHGGGGACRRQRLVGPQQGRQVRARVCNVC